MKFASINVYIVMEAIDDQKAPVNIFLVPRKQK